MRLRQLSMIALAAAFAAAGTGLLGQTGTADEHVKAAERAAGTEYVGLFNQLCAVPGARGGGRAGAGGGAAAAPGGAPRGAGAPAGAAAAAGGGGARGAGAPGGATATAGAAPAPAGRAGGRGTPDRSTWYAEPVKVFDNVYFLGQTEFTVWAIDTSDGIILTDAIFDYSVEAEVTDGLKKMGLDPKRIKYAIISHAHGDHDGGAKYLQDTYGARLIMGKEDWASVDARTTPHAKHDIDATDGMKVTLGDTTVTVYLTPGHTPGTISTVIPVKDKGTSHTALLWGGTLLNRQGLTNYIASTAKMRDVVEKQKVDILLSNHTAFDGSKVKLPAVLARKGNDPHPYIVGTPSVTRFLTMAGECAQAASLQPPAAPPAAAPTPATPAAAPAAPAAR